MAKVKNITDRDLIVPPLGDRLVFAGQEIEVPDADLPSYVCQAKVWREVKAHHPKKADKPAADSQEG